MSEDEGKRRAELGELLILLAHDLKNPLAAVLTNLGFVGGVLAEVGVESDANEALQDAQLACESLQRLVGNLEIVARDSAQQGSRSSPPTDASPLDLSSVADEVVRRQQEAAASRRLIMTIRVQGGRCYARADRDLVIRVTENLLANALQHAPGGSEIELEIGRRSGDAREIELAVVDSGAIVPADLRAEVVTAAGQGRSKGRPDGRYGRGLALYVAALAARATGGRLEIGERRGLCAFALVLPEHDERSSIV